VDAALCGLIMPRLWWQCVITDSSSGQLGVRHDHMLCQHDPLLVWFGYLLSLLWLLSLFWLLRLAR
jgi:hypothetical protein